MWLLSLYARKLIIFFFLINEPTLFPVPRAGSRGLVAIEGFVYQVVEQTTSVFK